MRAYACTVLPLDSLDISEPTLRARAEYDTYKTSSSDSATYAADALCAGVNPSNEAFFISAAWNATAFTSLEAWYGFAFGLDSSLTLSEGWDNATGFGTPYGARFIDAAAARSR